MSRKQVFLCLLAGTTLLFSACGQTTDDKELTQEEIDSLIAEYGIVTEITEPPTIPELYISPEGFDPAPVAPEQQSDEYESKILSIATNMQPSDTIWRNYALDPSDPENLDNFYEEGSPFISEEGKVYANDRILSIDIPSFNSSETYSFTFGYITGEYNSFLYLNPTCSLAEEGRPIGYYASVENYEQGEVFSRNERIECNVPADHVSQGENVCNYWIPNQSYDILASATYTGATTPGLAYFTSKPLEEEYAIVNIRAVDLCRSTTIAIIRLYIAKNPDLNTYYLHHAENANLLQTGPNVFLTQDMIDSALEQTKTMLEEGTIYHITDYSKDAIFLMEYLNEDRSYYFDTVCPIYANNLPATMPSYKLTLPAIAVTVCTGRYGQGPETIYLGIYGTHLQILAHDLPNPHDYEMCIGRLSSGMQ